MRESSVCLSKLNCLDFRQKAIQTSNKWFTSQQMCLPITVLENSDSDQEEFQNSISHFGSMDLKIEGFKEIGTLESIKILGNCIGS